MDGHHDDPDRALDNSDGSPSQASLSSYSFPDDRLKKVMDDQEKTPLLLVACGSFSPITYLHLRMFEMAADYVKFSTKFELIGGYLSPVSDAYRKAGLASARHRIAMCRLAVDKTSNWLMVDPWEALQKEYSPTAKVLDHFDHEINTVRGGIDVGNGTRKPVRIALLAGADLIHTMSTPGVWSEEDLDHILGRYGTFIVERSGTDIDEAIAGLQPWKDNIYVIQQLIQNDVSSTKIRLFLRREMSVRYLIPGPVISYIEKHNLYEEDGVASVSSNAVDKGATKHHTSEAKASAFD
ncbi:nicotinamide-nucleotide adenylyltransferase 2 [Uncinocarpus reesii 1704]|uniref:Nicotinamide-nucleotide adenylyltransferase n=1 Tax=Uncinocarpus reesii (strain UAMH 1704) TaxID=336963 RepID=C4JGH8_UNCRE|nr:nicotinamide-nucleotide adenylyltransferase 2 [Uncinocarpus reesii 1704]EEP76320.1 nicotinamide-nucleotide adenylyltransferase 2 [Uncinocarpus reesii 1704]